MNFSSLIGLAKQANSEKNKQPVKGFSTTITPAKKPVRSNVPSASVKAFLEKRDQEQRDKVIQARKEKDRLLTLRAQNSKSNKAAKLMASRTKDNDFSRIRMTEDEIEARDKVEAQLRRQVIADKVERMRERIKLQDYEAQLPHKRKRKPKAHNDMNEKSPSPPPPPPVDPPSRPNGIKKPRPPPPSFKDLMKMASVKQYEDPDDDKPELEEKGRPMTKAEKLEDEYKKYKINGGTGGRTDFELAYFRMQKNVKNEDNLKPCRRRIPKKPPPREADVIPETREVQRAPETREVHRPPEKTNSNRVSNTDSGQRFNDNRNNYRSDDRDAYRSAESKGIQRTSDKSVQRSSETKRADRVSDSKNNYRTGDRDVYRSADTKGVQRTSDKSVQRPNDTRNSDRVNDRNVQRTQEAKSVQRSSNIRNSQQNNESRNSRYVEDYRSSERTNESVHIPQTGGNKVPQRNSYNVENRMQKDMYRSQEKTVREQTPKVPSYTTVKKQSARPDSDDQNSGRSYKNDTNSDSQYRTPATKPGSAFLNSLPNKKPKLGFAAKESPKSAMVSKYDAEIEKQKVSLPKPKLKQSNVKDKVNAEPSLNRQPDSSRMPKRDPNEHINRSREMSSKPPTFKKPLDERKPIKVALNDNWLEDDGPSQEQRMFNVPKKKLPQNHDRNQVQKRPLEPEERRDRPISHKASSGNQPPSKKSNPNGQYSEKKYRQQDSDQNSEKYRPPQKKMKSNADDYRQTDHRSDNRVVKKSSGSSQLETERKHMGPASPTGSRRNLDTLWPMKSMARNPNKLPPIRSSKCSYIKSDSEEDEEEEEEEDFDDDMADFIDDEPLSESEDYSRHIREIFGYDKRKYRNEKFDDEDVMESSFFQQMKEEQRSTRIGRLEDLEEERKDMERRQIVVPSGKKKR